MMYQNVISSLCKNNFPKSEIDCTTIHSFLTCLNKTVKCYNCTTVCNSVREEKYFVYILTSIYLSI